MQLDTSFGHWLKQRRRELDLTQDELARRVGCATTTIQKIETGERRPSRQIAERLASSLDIAADQRAAFLAFARSGQSAPPTAMQPPSNLPIPPTPLFGREADLAAVRARLLRDDTRVLTLLGPPGIGKTRLALEVAAALCDRFENGVCFVALAPVRDPNLVAPTIAQALDLREFGGQPLAQRLIDYLCDREVLLVLDNCEQVVAAARLIAQLLAACLRLKILATSRAALRIRAERRYLVPPLALPNPMQLPPAEELTSYPAIALFADRAQAVQPDFAIAGSDASAVATICHRLDGLPLAIELIAARVRVLPLAALLARLDGHFLLQTDGLRDVDERQRTLHNAIDWSYSLLSEAERTLFIRLGVFVGGCTLEAAEAVCADQMLGIKDGDSIPDPRFSILDRLGALIDKSLLQQKTGSEGEARFTMLEAIREYALERLKERGEIKLLRRRYAAYYLALAEDAEPKLHGAEQGRWFDRLEAEYNNIRSVLVWHKETTDDVALGLRLAGALWWFWLVRGYGNEGLNRLTSLLSQGGSEQPTTWRAKALNAAGFLSLIFDNDTAAEEHYQESLAISTALEHDLSKAYALSGMGKVASKRRDLARACSAFEESLALFRVLGDARGIVWTLVELALVSRMLGDNRRTIMCFEESLAMCRKQGDKLGVARVLRRMGVLLLDQDDNAHGRALLEESLILNRELGFAGGVASSLNLLGELARKQGDYARAATLYEESLILQRKLGEPGSIAGSLHNLAYVAQHQNDYERGAALFVESLSLYRKIGNLNGVIWCLAGLAGLASARRQPERSACLFGTVEMLLEGSDAYMESVDRVEYDRNLAAARALLDEAAFAVAWERGREMTIEQAIAESLADP